MYTASNEMEQNYDKIVQLYKITVTQLGAFKSFQIIINTNTNAPGRQIFPV